MRKFFLIPVLALFTCVSAWGATVEVGTFAELKSAIESATNGDVIKLTADIAYPANVACLDITKSITIDGQKHEIIGYGRRNDSAYPSFAINFSSRTNESDVVFKDITITNNCQVKAYSCRPIETRGHVRSITLSNVILNAPNGDVSNAQMITVGGDDRGWDKKTTINITNSTINGGKSSYCITSFNPYILNAENSTFNSWCVCDFSNPSGSFGSRGSIINMDACWINTYNKHNTKTNAYAAFSLRDDGISLNLNNCKMNAEELGNQSQWILMLNNFAPADRRVNPVSLTITGDNSNLTNKLLSNGWTSGYYANEYVGESTLPAETFALNITITGGTYSFNPEEVYWFKNGLLEGEDLIDPSNIGSIDIPATHEVKTIETQQGDQTTTLYRVRKKITTAYSINDDAESHGEGQNENTEFIIQADETVNVPTDTVIANYVEVSNNATLTVPDGTQLEVTNGLDVTDGAQVVIEAGSTVIVGEGGVTSESTESIVITADENGSASFLLDPEVIVNTTPNLTVKMKAKAIGYDIDDEKEYYWFRFAAPVAGITELGKDKDRPTYIYKWNYAANEWSAISALSEMTPFQGYTLTTEYEMAWSDADDVEYTFHGQLAGNQNTTLHFQNRGFNYFGNSYTGYINVLALVEQLMEDNNIDGTVYMWDNGHQRFEGVPLADLRDNPGEFPDWKKEVAPMQTFILRQINTGDAVSTDLNYASAIWGNPRYGRVSTQAPAPRRQVSNDAAAITIVVTAANGSEDEITLKESADFGDEFNKGYDVVKFMNERLVNMYATVDGENYSTVATDNLEGKTISLQTVKSLNYTMSFKNVRGNEYAIRDNVTGAVIAIEEGAIYEFAAQPKSTVEGRFEIMPVAKVPTAIENTDAVKSNVKGIYTIMGQYLGEDFDILPAGVYVVNGVKIVK